MNTSALVIGFLLSMFITTQFRKNKMDRRNFLYAILLFSLPFYYFIFAVYAKDYSALSLEVMGGLAFFLIPLFSMKLSYFYKVNLIALGFILHGVYDIYHESLFHNEGTPLWWPEFCGVIDIVIGAYLVSISINEKYELKTNKIN